MIDYDARYTMGYMEGFADLYEAARLVAVRETLHDRALFPTPPGLIMDFACGQGRYFPVLKEAFPAARILGVDISHVGVQKARAQFPDERYTVGMGEKLPLAGGVVDLIFSIETLEHVQDVRATVREWARVLRPGGQFLFTTPCANPLSLEWVLMALTGGFEPSADGYGRFRRDEPGHLRRLSTRHVAALFAEAGLEVTRALPLARLYHHRARPDPPPLAAPRVPRRAARLAAAAPPAQRREHGRRGPQAELTLEVSE